MSTLNSPIPLAVQKSASACTAASTTCLRATLQNERGTATLVGDLVLDYVKVRYISTVDLQTLTGEGPLEPLDA